MKNTLFFVFTLLVTLLSGCKTIQSELPDTRKKPLPVLDQQTSSINLPISIDLKPYFKEIENTVPKTFDGEEQNCSGVSYTYHLKRSPISFQVKESIVRYDVQCAYSLNLNYCPGCIEVFNSESCVVPRIYASCGVDEPLRKMEIGYESRLSINPDWSFSSKTKLHHVAPLDPCKVTFVNYDATEELVTEVKNSLVELEPEIDKSIQAVDLKSAVSEAWEALNEPIDLGGYGMLYLSPQNISVDNLKFKNDSAYVNVNLSLLPKVNLSPLSDQKQKLPQLTEYRKSNGFEMIVDIKANYDSLNAILRREFIGYTYEYKRKKLVLTDFVVHSSSDSRINFALNISGSKKGVLYLHGTPHFDSVTQQISIPDLEFDLKTKDAILKSAKWIFNAKIEDKLRLATIFNLTQQLANLKSIIESELNGEIQSGIFMSSKLTNLQVLAIYPFTNELFVRAKIGGNLKLRM